MNILTLLAIIFYVIGAVTTYAYAKYYRNRTNQNTWVDVVITAVFAMASWFGLILLKYIKEHTINGNRNEIQPPKFL